MRRAVLLLVLYGALAVFVLLVLGTRMTGMPPLGAILDPLDGLYRTARLSDSAPPREISIPDLEGPVEVVWDDRGVPHIFADHDLDAVAALGYAVARDRLFQLDFLARAGSGRLSEALGSAGVGADRFLRSIGMEWGARKNMDRIEREHGVELRLLESYCRGVNTYIDALASRDLPFEFRLLGYRPDRCTPIQSLRLLQYMNYDLSYRTDDPAYGRLRERLSEEDYDLLYPDEAEYFVPIIPPSSSAPAIRERSSFQLMTSSLISLLEPESGLAGSLLEGFRHGKGSNNWAVADTRSATGHPILAGDMHLRVSLPSIWYEAHLVTPAMNTYGVTIPGAPLPVEAYNDHIGWTFTNTGSDQIDHYFLRLDSTSSRYWFDGGWRDLDLVVDTIFVKGDRPIVDTLRYAHWGPVIMQGREAIALRWVAHDSSRTLQALLGMNRAADHEEFQSALRQWDTPMQNVLFADVEGNISVRSTGYMPIRRGGHGKGLLDGSTDSSDWIGRIPFDSLPHAVNPPQGFLTSTNQKPTDSTYPYYLDHDWRIGYRSIRIDSILRSKERHTVEDLKSYQADVGAVQRDFLVGFLDTLSGVTERADSLRRMLRAWNGQMTVDRREPLLVDFLMQELERLTWDEPEFTPAYDVGAAGDTLSGPFRVPRPGESRIFKLLAEYPSSKWLDVQSTAVREDAAGLLRLVLDSAADRYDQAVRIGSLWGDHRKIRFNFIIDNESFSALGRGPFEYSGYEETLSPAKDSITTHSASTRLVVDFSQSPPRGSIVYPGGQSGNPFSRRYDLHLPVYLGFMHYDPLKPASAAEFQNAAASHRSILQSR